MICAHSGSGRDCSLDTYLVSLVPLRNEVVAVSPQQLGRVSYDFLQILTEFSLLYMSYDTREITFAVRRTHPCGLFVRVKHSHTFNQ